MKFQQIKKKYLETIKSHKETKSGYRKKQREYSIAMRDSGDTEKKDLRYPYDALSDMEKSCVEIRSLHVAYSLLKGTPRVKIEKEIDTSIDYSVEYDLKEMISLLGVELEIIKDDNGSILQVNWRSHEG